MTMNFRASFILYTFALFYLTIVLGSEERKCNPTDLIKRMCLDNNEVCHADATNQTSGVCRCKDGYIRNKINQTECVKQPVSSSPSPASATPSSSPEHAEIVHHGSVSTGAITAAVLVPLLLAVGALVVLLGRRYHWFERLQLLQGRRYEEVRIGQEDDEDDDPPLA